MNKKDICSYNYDELKEEMLAIGEKAFRSKQIYEWLHVKLADDFDEMTNLSKALREKLKEEYVILPVKSIIRYRKWIRLRSSCLNWKTVIW